MRPCARKMLLWQDSAPRTDGSGIPERRIFGSKKVLSLYPELRVLLILTSSHPSPLPVSVRSPASSRFPQQDHPLWEGSGEEAGRPGGKTGPAFELGKSSARGAILGARRIARVPQKPVIRPPDGEPAHHLLTADSSARPCLGCVSSACLPGLTWGRPQRTSPGRSRSRRRCFREPSWWPSSISFSFIHYLHLGMNPLYQRACRESQQL